MEGQERKKKKKERREGQALKHFFGTQLCCLAMKFDFRDRRPIIETCHCNINWDKKIYFHVQNLSVYSLKYFFPSYVAIFKHPMFV